MHNLERKMTRQEFASKAKNLKKNRSTKAIGVNMILAALSLFVNGFGVYLTIAANIGAGPWDVLNLGISKQFGILYGTASVIVSYSILGLDIGLKEPIGIAMFIDAVVVGKSVDFFNMLHVVTPGKSTFQGILIMIAGLIIMAFTQYTYMSASLGCGPRDTLLVALTKRMKAIPIGAVSIGLLGTATLIGWLLGGPVGIGTLICAFATGPIMQMVFKAVHFDATKIHHQHLVESLGTVLSSSCKN